MISPPSPKYSQLISVVNGPDSESDIPGSSSIVNEGVNPTSELNPVPIAKNRNAEDSSETSELQDSHIPLPNALPISPVESYPDPIVQDLKSRLSLLDAEIGACLGRLTQSPSPKFNGIHAAQDICSELYKAVVIHMNHLKVERQEVIKFREVIVAKLDKARAHAGLPACNEDLSQEGNNLKKHEIYMLARFQTTDELIRRLQSLENKVVLGNICAIEKRKYLREIKFLHIHNSRMESSEDNKIRVSSKGKGNLVESTTEDFDVALSWSDDLLKSIEKRLSTQVDLVGKIRAERANVQKRIQVLWRDREVIKDEFKREMNMKERVSSPQHE